MEEKIITAKTLDEAITKACVDLGVPSGELDYTIRQTGSNGFFGIGAKPFVISARIRSEAAEPEAPSAAPAPVVKEAPAQAAAEEPRKEADARAQKQDRKQDRKPDRGERRQDRQEKGDRGQRNEKKDRQKKSEKTSSREAKQPRQERSSEEKKPERRFEKPAEDPTPRAEAFLNSLFESMDMKISCSAVFHPENNELDVDLSGDDMGVLIGKRGQTLDALQYLTSQVVNRRLNVYVRVKLDTENYRERRKETLETLAVNIAHKVRRSHRPVALEPMNPYERRIIHSVLQNEKDVTTRSEGEEPYRHVIVCPSGRRKQGRYNSRAESSKQDAAREARELSAEEIEIRETVVEAALQASVPEELLPAGARAAEMSAPAAEAAPAEAAPEAAPAAEVPAESAADDAQ